MPTNNPTPEHSPDVSITPDEMLSVRDYVRARLVAQLHSTNLIGNLYRKVGNYPRAAMELATANELKAMIQALDEHSGDKDSISPDTIRLLEELENRPPPPEEDGS